MNSRKFETFGETGNPCCDTTGSLWQIQILQFTVQPRAAQIRCIQQRPQILLQTKNFQLPNLQLLQLHNGCTFFLQIEHTQRSHSEESQTFSHSNVSRGITSNSLAYCTNCSKKVCEYVPPLEEDTQSHRDRTAAGWAILLLGIEQVGAGFAKTHMTTWDIYVGFLLIHADDAQLFVGG